MRYIADCLTALKGLLAFAVPFTIIGHTWWVLAVLIIAIGLCDAFDGIAARRWPYTAFESASKFWRRPDDGHTWDQIPNGVACVTILATLCVMAPWWGIPLSIVVVIGTILFQGGINRNKGVNPKKAELIDVIYGWTWTIVLFLTASFATYRATTSWTFWVFAVYFLGALGLLLLKQDRATSRPEVDYTKK
jgi:hypothetical protein